MQDLGKLTKDYSAKQWKAIDVLGEYIPSSNKNISLIDLGCGTGDAYEKIEQIIPNVQYIGVDIDKSPEVLSRKRADLKFMSYDGVNLPFTSNSYDVVYCVQVFEHVRYQEQLLKDIVRVLKKTGFFIGSLSGLEPYHSYSIFNLTPYGCLKILNDAGFHVNTMRPGVDGLTLLNRSLSIRTRGNYITEDVGELNKKILSMNISDIEKNRLMLNYTGHIIFCAQLS